MKCGHTLEKREKEKRKEKEFDDHDSKIRVFLLSFLGVQPPYLLLNRKCGTLAFLFCQTFFAAYKSLVAQFTSDLNGAKKINNHKLEFEEDERH